MIDRRNDPTAFPMAAKRVYSDKEISALLKRASEIQREEGPMSAAGLSLSELEQIASEVGIDPRYLKTAALELDERQSWDSFHPLGAPTSIDLERIVDGEMTEEEWDEAVGEFRRVFSAQGEVVRIGRTREWTHFVDDDERVHVTVSPAERQTRIRVLQRMWVWALSLHVPLMGFSIAPIAIQYKLLDLGPTVETGIAASILVACHMIARYTYGAVVRKQDRRIRKLLSFLDEIVTKPSASVTREGETAKGSVGVASVAAEDEKRRRAELAQRQALEGERRGR